MTDPQLRRTLGPVMLWALGVGYVISGMYFGWNLGLPLGGPYGMLAATALVTVMYVTFVLSYAELSCALPRAGGAFVYARHGLGPGLGYLAGVAQCVEFVFAPPAIAAAIGAYASLFLKTDPLAVAIGCYVVFTALNAWGVKQSALFELAVTVLAVLELLLFAGVAGSRFTWEAFSRDPLPNGWAGAFAAIPYAIWFYLAIEGLANVAEETRAPERELPRGFISAMGTLVVLAVVVLFSAVGVDGWRSVVYPEGSADPSDSPLPLALGRIVAAGHPLYQLLIGIGLCGLVASFHGIILVAGRATMELGRAGYAPAPLSRIHAVRQTPTAALATNMVLGIGALLTGKTGDIITMSVFGALTLYVVSMLALFGLRRSDPDLARPFHAPGYPVLPAIALGTALVCLAALFVQSPVIGLVYVAVLAVAFAWYFLGVPETVREAPLAKNPETRP